MKPTPPTVTGLLRAALTFLCSATFARSAVSFTDIRLWAGAPAGPGTNEAALVVDFHDGLPGLVWGYRWPSAETRTGGDMLMAVLGADHSLHVDSTFFPNSFSYGPRSRSFSDNGTPANYFDDIYWGYWVNNEVYYHPTDFLLNSHIVPPATEVVPLGNPYGPGHWVESSTGLAARPLVNGSWDAWSYGPYGTQAGEPVPAVPEPSAGMLALSGLFILTARRRGLRQCAGAVTMMCAAVPVQAAGPFPGGPAESGSDAIPAASALFTGWADSVVSFQPGPRQAGTNSLPANYGSISSTTGPPDAAGSEYDMAPAAGPVLSLGDGGQVTLRFAPPVTDGDGPDFAVFENGFATASSAVFAELAFVEVSSNGTDFARFPAVSCTPVVTQTGTFGTLDPHDLHNLAGKHPAGYGTPFDLAEIAGANPLVDVRRITHVRLVDVVGDVKTGRGSRDSLGNWINDPWPTNFQTSGFDLDAVGAIHHAPDAWREWVDASFPPDVRENPAVASPDADPDNDGRSNLVEYACDSPPLVADSAPPLSTAADESVVTLQFHRSQNADATVALEHSANGLTWELLPDGGDGLPPLPVTVARPRTAAREFFRLKIVRPS